jgi:Flp pilus assembly protein protease CpaA
MSYQWLELAFKVLVTLWLVTVAVWDFLTRRIPNWLVLPVMLPALCWQVYRAIQRAPDGLLFALGTWAVLYTMWRAHVFGGGDAKFLMALFALFPTAQFLLLFSLVVLAVSIPIIVIQYVSPRLRGVPDADRSASERSVLPSAERLRTRGQPFSWTFALPGVLYLWLGYF